MVRNGTLYFAARDSTAFNAPWLLWRSDGTPDGTRRATELNNGNAYSPTSGGPDRLFFAVDRSLWIRDAAGSRLVEQTGAATPSSSGEPLNMLRVVGDKLYFGSEDSVTGHEPWVSDGTAAGTFQLGNLNTEQGVGSGPRSFVPLGDHVYFSALTSRVLGTRPLFRTQGTPESTEPVPGVNVRTFALTAFADDLLFGANGASGGIELWSLDGATGQPALLADINPGDGHSSPDGFRVIGDRMYFTADDGVHGREVWVTDGTAGGTLRVTDINPGAASANPLNLTDLNGQLLFTAFDGTANKLYIVPEPSTAATIAFAGLSATALSRRRRRDRRDSLAVDAIASRAPVG